MDLMLLIIIPLAVVKDMCCSKTPGKRKQFKNRVVSIFACACFGVIFLVDAFIFNTYFDQSSLFDSQQQPTHARPTTGEPIPTETDIDD